MQRPPRQVAPGLLLPRALAILALGSPVSAGERLRVLTYNVAAIPLVHPHWNMRRDAIARRLKESDYDLIALQEAWRDKDALALSLGSGMPHYARYERRLSIGTGLAALSRLPILEKSQRNFTCRPSALRARQGESLVNKGAVMTRVMTARGPLDVYNAHLIAEYPGARYRTIRLTQLFEFAEMIQDLSAQRAVLILGDLNVGPGDSEFELFKDLLGLADACMAKGRETCGRTDGHKRVDHVLLPSGAGPGWAKARAVLTGLLPGTRLPYSDHFGVEAEFDYRFLGLRIRPEPKRRLAALSRIESALAGMSEAMERRLRTRSWIPLLGFAMAWRYEHQLSQLRVLRARVETARIRTLRACQVII